MRIRSLALSLIWLILSLTALEVCAEQINTPDTHNTLSSTLENPIETDAQEVLGHIHTSKKLREKLPEFIQEASDSIKQHNGAIPSALALKIARSLKEADIMRNQLFKQALNHRSALYRVDQEISDQTRINEIIIAMSAAVLLYENHQAMHDSFKAQGLLRQKINEANPELGIESGYYQSSMARAENLEYRKAMSDAIDFFNDNQDVIQHLMAKSSIALQALAGYISESPLLVNYEGGNIFGAIIKLPIKAITEVKEMQSTGLKQLKFNSSRMLGNTLGLVRWRDGKLKHNQAFEALMVSQLQPGDILLEKTPFTLTDKTIPGHFGHVALYVGTYDQLKALDLHDSPMVRQHLKKVHMGAGVVEALRNGVQLNRLSEFMNIDDFAVLRPKNRTAEQQRNAVKIAVSNVGKRYDFNFDVNTTETIVCSELVYIAYPEIDFVTKRVLDSYTISPDDIAMQAGEDAQYPLELVIFAHDGKLVLDQNTDQNGQAMYASLVRPPPRNLDADEASKAFFRGFIARQ